VFALLLKFSNFTMVVVVVEAQTLTGYFYPFCGIPAGFYA
jgi:hypothetical protein